MHASQVAELLPKALTLFPLGLSQKEGRIPQFGEAGLQSSEGTPDIRILRGGRVDGSQTLAYHPLKGSDPVEGVRH